MAGRHSFKNLYDNFSIEEKREIQLQTNLLIEEIEASKLEKTASPSLSPEILKPKYQPAK